jgi:hypothetical protein
MTKRIFFLLGVIAGVLFTEIFRRKHIERLRVLEAKQAFQDQINDEADARWQKELENMPFEKRIDYELFEASLKASNYKPDWAFEEDDNETT